MATMSALLITAPCESNTTPRSAPVDASCPQTSQAIKNKDELKQKQPENNYSKSTANRRWKQPTTAAHKNPLASKTSESEGIPEALLNGVSPRISHRV